MNPVIVFGAGALVLFGLLSLFKKKAKAQPVTPVTQEKMLSSPITGVSDSQWTEFVKRSKWGNKDTRTDSKLYGWFLFTLEDLKDFAGIDNPTEDRLNQFLSSSDEQYAAMVAMTKNHEGYIKRSSIRGAIGNQFDGEAITMSGLLGLSHQLGLRGLENWLADGSVRTNETIEAFQSTNGAF